MKKIFTLSLLLASLLCTALPAAATSLGLKPGKPKPIERTRRHLHRASMQRIHKTRAQR